MKLTFPPALGPGPTPAIDEDAIRYASQLTVAGHACCCPAQPTVIAVLPPAPGRPHATELLLCGHHYRADHAALTAANARVLDRNGRRVIPGFDLCYSAAQPTTVGAATS